MRAQSTPLAKWLAVIAIHILLTTDICAPSPHCWQNGSAGIAICTLLFTVIGAKSSLLAK